MRLARMLLIGGVLLAAGLPAAAGDPVAVAPQAAVVDPAPPVPTQPAPLRHPALRNTGIVTFALGAVQVVAGGVLLGLASSSCSSADCRTANQVVGGIAVPVMVVGGVFALVPGAIMWGVGSRL